MDTSLDNANNPFANSNGSDNTTTTTTTASPPPSPSALQATIDTDSLKSDGFLVNLSTENNCKQIGGGVDDLLSSRTNDFYQKLEKSNGKRPASAFDDDDDDDDDLEENNDNIIDIDNERDEDDNDDDVVDDLGPETDVDTADVLSPSMITAKALADGIMNNNPEGSFNPFVEKEEVEKAALEIHHDLQKLISEDDDDDNDDDDDGAVIDRKTPITPPIVECEKTDVAATVPVHDVGGSLEENVADSGDDSEDEWNYIKGDDADKENLNPVQPEQEVAASIEEDPDNMSQLNPNAAEFVPVSPTRSIPSPACQALIMNDPVISQSPKRAADIDISVPNQKDFENEVKSRPSDVGICDSNGHEIIDDNDEPQSPTQELENLLNGKNIDEIPEFQPISVLTPTKISNDEFHFGPNATPFTPGKLLDQSVTGLSTRAVYGDESTATIQSFDESAFGQDNIDFTSSTLLNNKENDPMSMSFYQEKTDVAIDELNRVQTLPEDLDDFINKPDETTQQLDNTVITKTEQSEQMINLDNDERIVVQTTDLDKIVDYEKDIASPIDNDMFDVCELPKSPDLISNDIVEKANEEDKEKIVEKEMVEEKDKEQEKEIAEEKELVEETVNETEVEAICHRIAKSPELVALSPSPEPIQNDLLQNQDNLLHLETDHSVVAEEEKQPQQQQHQLLLDDLVEQKPPTPEPKVDIFEAQNPATLSPLATHKASVVETPTSQVEIVKSPEPTLEDSHHYTHEETRVLCSADSSNDIENKEDSAIGSPIEDITSSVKDTTSPIVMSPIPDQEIAPVSEQETAPVGESSPIIEKQPEKVLVPEICTFSPPESVATAEVNSFLERSEISDVHSPLVASPVAVARLTNDTNDEPTVVSEQANILDLDHPLSKCVFPLPPEHTETTIIKTEEVIDDNKVEDNKKAEQDSSIVVEEIVEQKAEQTENTTPEVAATTVGAAAAAMAVAATATAVTAATVVEKKATEKSKTIAKKAPTATSKTTPSKLTAAMSKPKPTTKPPASRTAAGAAKSTTSAASPKATTTTKTNVSKLATAKPKATSSPSAPNKTGVDKKPMTNGDVKSARSAIAIKKTDSTTTTTAAKPSSSRSVASTLNKTSPTKSGLAAAGPQPAKVSSSTATSKISSTTSATTKPRPTTLAPKTTSTTKTSSLSANSKTTATKATSSTRTALSSPRTSRPTTTTTTTTTAKPRVPLTKTITKTSADTEKQNKESANKLTASRSSTTTTTKTTGKTLASTLKKTEIKNSGSSKTTVTKTTATVTGKKPNEIARNLKTTTTKTTKIEKPIQNGISSVVTEQIIVNNDNEPQLVKDNSPIDNKLMVEATNNATD